MSFHFQGSALPISTGARGFLKGFYGLCKQDRQDVCLTHEGI